MRFFESIWQAILDALTILWEKLVDYLPNLLAAVIILIVGIIIAKAAAKLVEKIVEALKIDPLIKKINIVQKIEEAGTKVELSKILGWLVKWFLYIVLTVAVTEIMKLGQFTTFLKDIALYLPNVIIAVLILVVGLVLGDFVEKLVVSILKGTKARLAALVGVVAKWSICIFAVLAALIQLQVAVVLINTLFTAIVVTIALAAGLAFGLGGKDAAKDFIDKMKRNISS
jgi:small-conductance mechanosensitive channel